jgi:hypothetical protein
MYYTVRDSSVFQDPNSYSAYNNKENRIMVGTVREELFDKESKQTKYLVDVWLDGITMSIVCSNCTRFGGIYNYEEYTRQTYKVDDSKRPVSNSVIPGDHVIVAFLGGDAREGVILSGYKHFGRRETIDFKKDSASSQFLNRETKIAATKYASEFNGVEKMINADGEYRVTFKGQPTNLANLVAIGDKEIPNPQYDTSIGSSYYEFDKTGSYFITDNSKENPQSIKIDKQNGKVIITSGKTSLVIDKKEESYIITNKKVTFNTATEWNLNTKSTSIKSSNVIIAESKDIKTTGKITQKGDVQITGGVKQTGNNEITGNLKTTGETLLAGGSFPLIYDIVLILGVGNAGAPVVSSAIVLKTALTKAT